MIEDKSDAFTNTVDFVDRACNDLAKAMTMIFLLTFVEPSQ